MKKVRIQAKREVTYNVVVELPEEDFNKVKSLDWDDVDFNDNDKFFLLESHLDTEGEVNPHLFEDVRVEEL